MRDSVQSISVIVPAYNAEHTIKECVEALLCQSTPPSVYEVIVVDDGSTDDTGRIAARLGATVLHQANRGPAAARNLGLKKARGGVILFTDADCAPSADWVQQMIAPLSDPQIAGSKGIYRTRQRSLTARFVQVEYEDRYDYTAQQPFVDLVDTHAACYRRGALLASGGFDARFRYCEDQELSFRMAEAGYKMAFCPRAAVYHHHPDSWRMYARKKARIGYWKAFVLRLHPGKAQHDSHTPENVKLQMLLAALSAPLAVSALRSELSACLLAATLIAFLLSAAPFLLKVWRVDRIVALISLPALYLRAWSLGLGLVAGYLHRLLGRGPLSPRSRTGPGGDV